MNKVRQHNLRVSRQTSFVYIFVLYLSKFQHLGVGDIISECVDRYAIFSPECSTLHADIRSFVAIVAFSFLLHLKNRIRRKKF